MHVALPAIRRFLPLALLAIAVLSLANGSRLLADVIVLSNRTDREVTFSLQPTDLPAREYRVAAGDLVAAPMIGKVRVAFDSGTLRRQVFLDANSAYFLVAAQDGGRELLQIDLGGTERTSRGTGVARAESFDEPTTLPVKILVDEDERAAEKVWQDRLRKRVANASAVFEKYCRVKLEVVEIATWQSDNRVNDFNDSLKEFEQEVSAAPARIAIGFTSQYEIPQGRVHLGGTRGPLHSHILIREWSQHITESERLEVLIHELGHVLGCAHSPDQNSVMRPMLGDRRSRAVSFRIGFDPPNMVAMSLVAEELRVRKIRNLGDLSPATVLRLREIYAAIDKALPTDPAAAALGRLLARQSLGPLAKGTRRVLEELSRAAEANARLDLAETAPTQTAARRVGDELTAYYFRQAAWAARDLPADEARIAFLLGLGIGLDDTGVLSKIPQLKEFIAAIENDEARAKRKRNLGKFTILDRDDLARHYTVSALLTALGGAKQAEAIGVAKEFVDTQRDSGFSFIDLAADRAGIRFAESVLAGKVSLLSVANDYSVSFFMPSIEGLPEGLTAGDFLSSFGSPTDARFLQVIRDIDTRLGALPPYREKLVAPRK
jgi:hypothetical protein